MYPVYRSIEHICRSPMGNSLLSEKLELLQIYYPDYSTTFLEELLHSCDDDVEKTRALIEGPQPRKRSNLYQRSIFSHIKRRKECKDDQGFTSFSTKSYNHASRVITLYTPEDVERHLGKFASFYPNFLPEKLSNELLHDLKTNLSSYKANEFYLFGNHCVSNHSVAVFSEYSKAKLDLIYNGLLIRNPVPYTNSFSKSVQLLQDFLNDTIIPQTEPLPFQRREKWAAEYCLVNYYEKLSNNLDWHSDRLSHIGPHNYIASVSLGCTRLFRLRSNHKKNAPIFEIPLPHNSLLVMRPGCQEEYKHCVNSMSKSVALHPEVGSTRFGLTFRHYPPEFIKNSPRCKCGLGMTLRRAFKSVDTRGRYFWSCENKYQNKDCGDFHWADFTNESNHYVAEDLSQVSTWVSPDDVEKIEYDKKEK
ncbi:putative alpha-ketoglutarate-dependent dioxygenase [Clavispora lusitaniae]|uniref:Alpha-ketoglutarate-dependent dioxygenase n=1 Tax=Clavispora lusitaniae TaxID=36911 RepID=A0ACD0WPK7_CLALS|nr:putative alpha-ketoglutarate-dependent dioxygenase [Clavispora lusitaniae]QFZ34620.1 putative alpha-ketoglutarate-dependent dioxygenase [Clavispora lusitaniae]QFZ40305.1 putative alpha-ketoglutarate-dependent dioxygenase [Clavispora lusitaniae]QFZ45985.1 putative alpha-ketoglutarate-dependent dioxygenase [Clavispora lusitaniae]QFZ51647.1 putative alpha-ketoglutarate-dependent dioxygenase [Clavispora lusitaniae]